MQPGLPYPRKIPFLLNWTSLHLSDSKSVKEECSENFKSGKLCQKCSRCTYSLDVKLIWEHLSISFKWRSQTDGKWGPESKSFDAKAMFLLLCYTVFRVQRYYYKTSGIKITSFSFEVDNALTRPSWSQTSWLTERSSQELKWLSIR